MPHVMKILDSSLDPIWNRGGAPSLTFLFVRYRPEEAYFSSREEKLAYIAGDSCSYFMINPGDGWHTYKGWDRLDVIEKKYEWRKVPVGTSFSLTITK